MTNVLTDINTAITKLNTVLGLIPQLNSIAFNTLLQVNNIFGAAGLPAVNAAAITAINKQLTDSLALVGDIGVDAQALVGIVTSFVGSFEGLAAQAQAAVTAAQQAVATIAKPATT